MDKLFSIPTQQLTWYLLGVFATGASILAVLAVRDRTPFRIAVRNIPRRKMQTALILLGLMLATVLFSAAFTTGETLTNSLRTQALENIGQVDVVVRAEQPGSGGEVPFGAGGPAVTGVRERYFDQDLAGKIRERLADDESVAGAAPLAKETIPVTAPEPELSEPRVDVLGMDADSMKGFDTLTTKSGKTLALNDLKEGEVYVSQETAQRLNVGTGDTVEASLLQLASKPEGGVPPRRC